MKAIKNNNEATTTIIAKVLCADDVNRFFEHTVEGEVRDLVKATAAFKAVTPVKNYKSVEVLGLRISKELTKLSITRDGVWAKKIEITENFHSNNDLEFNWDIFDATEKSADGTTTITATAHVHGSRRLVEETVPGKISDIKLAAQAFMAATEGEGYEYVKIIGLIIRSNDGIVIDTICANYDIDSIG